MVEINLLPQQYRKQSQPNVWKYATWALLPITAAALLIPWVMTSTKTGDLQRQIDAVQGDLDTLAPQKKEHDQLIVQQTDLQKTTQIAQALRDQKTYWSNDLAAFSAQMPTAAGVSLSHLSMAPMTTDALNAAHNSGVYSGKAVSRQLTLSGTGSSQQAVIDFLNTFENSPNFGVNFQGMTHNEQSGQYVFNATVGVVGSAPAAVTKPGNAPAGTATVSAPSAPATPVATTPVPASAPIGGTNVK